MCPPTAGTTGDLPPIGSDAMCVDAGVAPLDEVEIQAIPPISEGEAALLDAHSLINAFHALMGQLDVLGYALSGRDNTLQPAIAVCEQMLEGLGDTERGMAEALAMPRYDAQIMTLLSAALDRYADQRHDPVVEAGVTVVRHVLDVLGVRACEYLARRKTPHLWVELSAGELRSGLMEFFRVVEANAGGRFGVVFTDGPRRANDYRVDLRFGRDDEVVRLPDTLRDVMRDLAANARKYTAPGGTIVVSLGNPGGSLCLAVSDTGRGIPAEELETVVQFGCRGTNVFDVRALGGGFGLTKAFLTAKRFGGRFWIASRLGVGTRVRLEVPGA